MIHASQRCKKKAHPQIVLLSLYKGNRMGNREIGRQRFNILVLFKSAFKVYIKSKGKLVYGTKGYIIKGNEDERI